MDSLPGGRLAELLRSQLALKGALDSAGDALAGSDSELVAAAEKCARRAEELFQLTADVVLDGTTSAQQEGVEAEGVARAGQKTQAAYEALAKEVDSLLIRLSLGGMEEDRALVEAARSTSPRNKEKPATGEELQRRLSSHDGLCNRDRSLTASSVASTAPSDSDGSYSDADCSWSGGSGGSRLSGVRRGERLVLVSARESMQEAGVAVHDCCSALAMFCTLLHKQLLMKENVQCLLDSCARSSALRQRCQQRLDEHAKLWEALAVSCQQYSDGRKASLKAAGLRCR